MANSHRDNLRYRICSWQNGNRERFTEYLRQGYCYAEATILAGGSPFGDSRFFTSEEWRRAFYAPKAKRYYYQERNRSLRAEARAACEAARKGDYSKADTLTLSRRGWWD